MNKCDKCGRFHDKGPGSAWMLVYYGSPPTPSHDVTRCIDCVKRHGGYATQHGIKPECSGEIDRRNLEVAE